MGDQPQPGVDRTWLRPVRRRRRCRTASSLSSAPMAGGWLGRAPRGPRADMGQGQWPTSVQAACAGKPQHAHRARARWSMAVLLLHAGRHWRVRRCCEKEDGCSCRAQSSNPVGHVLAGWPGFGIGRVRWSDLTMAGHGSVKEAGQECGVGSAECGMRRAGSGSRFWVVGCRGPSSGGGGPTGFAAG